MLLKLTGSSCAGKTTLAYAAGERLERMTAPPHRLEPYAQLPDRYSDRNVGASTVDALGRVVTLLVPPEAACTRRVPPGPAPPHAALAVVMEGTEVHEVDLPDLDLLLPWQSGLGAVPRRTHLVPHPTVTPAGKAESASGGSGPCGPRSAGQ